MMTKMKVFHWFVTASNFFPAIIGLTRFRIFNFSLRIASVYFTLTALICLLANLMAANGIHNIWIYTFTNLFDGIAVFYLIISWSGIKYADRYWLLSASCYTIYWIWSTIAHHALIISDIGQESVKGISIILLSLLSLFKLSNKDLGPFWKDYRFLFLSGLLIYYAESLFPRLTENINFGSNFYLGYLSFIIVEFTALVTNLIFMFSFLCFNPKKSTCL